MKSNAVIDAYATQITIDRPDGEPLSADLPTGYRDVEAIRSAMEDVLESASPARVRSVEVVLHPPLVQTRTLTGLPPLRESDLTQLVLNQHSRFFRAPDGEPIVSAAWGSSDDGPVAHAALAEHCLLETLEEAVTAGGRVLVNVRPCDARECATLRLLTPRMRARERTRSLRWIAAAALVASSGWAAVSAAYLLDVYLDARTIGVEIDALEEPLSRIQALELRLSEFEPFAVAHRRQSSSAAWATPTLSGIAASLPRDTHLHRLVATRNGPLVLEAHGGEPVNVVEQLEAWWPGHVRLEGILDAGEGSAPPEERIFRVFLEEGS